MAQQALKAVATLLGTKRSFGGPEFVLKDSVLNLRQTTFLGETPLGQRVLAEILAQPQIQKVLVDARQQTAKKQSQGKGPTSLLEGLLEVHATSLSSSSSVPVVEPPAENRFTGLDLTKGLDFAAPAVEKSVSR